MVKKYDTMANDLKKVDKNCGDIIKYTTIGELPLFHGESNSLRQWIEKNNDPRIDFYKKYFKNAMFINNSPYGNVGIGAGSVKLKNDDFESFINNEFVENYPNTSCTKEIVKVLRNVDDVVTKRYFKNPEQCWITLMSKAGVERMAYQITLMKNGKTPNIDQLNMGLNDALTCLLYASIKHSLAFHNKWNKVSRRRSEANELKKFNELLNNSDFQNTLKIYVSLTNFKVNPNALRKRKDMMHILSNKYQITKDHNLIEVSEKLVEYLDSALN
jgi:hypothetical protein